MSISHRIVEILETCFTSNSTKSLKVGSVDSSVYSLVTRPADTTAYTALDVVGMSPAANISFSNIAVAGAGIIIMGVNLEIGVNAIPSGMGAFRLHLYSSEPTAIADNAAFNLIAADRHNKYLGYIDITTPTDFGDTLWSQNDNINFKCKLASNSTTLYGVLQTMAAYTPSSATIKR